MKMPSFTDFLAAGLIAVTSCMAAKKPILGVNTTKPGVYMTKDNPLIAYNDTDRPIMLSDTWRSPHKSWDYFVVNIFSDIHMGESKADMIP